MIQKKEIEKEIENIEDFSEIKTIPELTDHITDKTSMMREGFATEREYWQERVELFSSNFRDVKKIIDLQGIIYVDRQKVAEQKGKLYAAKIKFERSLRERRKKAFYKVRTQEDLSIKSKDEMLIFLEAELRLDLEKQEMLNSHIEFLDSTLKTIDNVIYGIANRIKIEELINR